MVPLYTYCLTTSEYGTADLMLTTVNLILPVFTLQIQDAMLRFSLDKNNDPSDIYTSGLKIVMIGSLILIVICSLCKSTAMITLDISYVILFLVLYILNAIRNISSYFCRGIDKIKTLTISTVSLTLITVLCNLIFLLIFKWNVYGYLLSICIGNAAAVAIMFSGAKLYKYIKPKNSVPKIALKIIKFSVPMVFSALSWWMNTSMDKYILGYFCGTSAVGLLAVAYKIPSVLSLFGTSIANAYSISAIKDFDKNDSDGFLGQSYSIINMFFVVGCSVLMLSNIFVSKLIFSNSFFEAWKFVPPLLVSSLLSMLCLTYENYYIAIKKTNIISATAVVGAITNLTLNLILIPKFSAYGAAVSTAIGFFVSWIIRYIILNKYIKLKHNFPAECISYIFIVIQMILAYFGNRYILFQVVATICIVIIYHKQLLFLISKALKFKIKG